MGVGKIGISQDRDSISIWNIYTPNSKVIDRDKYIQNCYLTGTVTLKNENAEIQSNVPIGKLAMQLVDFPEDSESQGSKVICVSAPYSGQLYVVDVYYTARQHGVQQEDQYRFFKSNGVGVAGVTVDGRGNIIITVDGDELNGTVVINATNQARTGKLNIVVNGDISIDNDGSTFVRTNKFEVGLKNLEPMLLGQTTVKLLDEILAQLGKESAGPYALLGNSKYLEFKDKLEDLKSKISFTQ